MKAQAVCPPPKQVLASSQIEKKNFSWIECNACRDVITCVVCVWAVENNIISPAAKLALESSLKLGYLDLMFVDVQEQLCQNMKTVSTTKNA